MIVVADTNTFLAVALDEPERPRLVELTEGHELAAPQVLPFEMGNALIAMSRGCVLEKHEVSSAWQSVRAISVALRSIDISLALDLAVRFGICAYDAYLLECALSLRAPILTLDRQMKRVARELSVLCWSNRHKEIHLFASAAAALRGARYRVEGRRDYHTTRRC